MIPIQLFAAMGWRKLSGDDCNTRGITDIVFRASSASALGFDSRRM